MNVTIDLRYDNYIFDLYGTLIDIHTEEGMKVLWKTMAKFYRKHGAFYLAGGLQKGYHKYVKEELQKSEEIQVERVFEKLFAKRHVRTNPETIGNACRLFRDTSTLHLGLYEWSLPILESLKANGKKVYLLSNAQRSFTYHEMDSLELLPYFDGIYISSDHGVKKPNQRFFEILIQDKELDVKKTLMVGNDENCDIRGAKQMGMDTMYIHTNCSPEYTGKVKATFEFLE